MSANGPVIVVPRRPSAASAFALLSALGAHAFLPNIDETPKTPHIRPLTGADEARMVAAEQKRERRRLLRQRSGRRSA